MKAFIILLFSILAFHGYSQSIVGTWQLMKQSNCLEGNMESTEVNELLSDRSTLSSTTHQVMEFKDNKTGEETIRTPDKRKGTTSSNFMYKHDGDNLYILNKKSQTITASYTIEGLTADSLIFSNSQRPCETKVFVRIK